TGRNDLCCDFHRQPRSDVAAKSCSLRAASAGDTSALVRQRIGPQLQLDGSRRVLLAALQMEVGAAAEGGPDFTPFPTSIRIVDAAVHVLGKEAHRIWH